MKAYPVFAKIDLSSTERTLQTLTASPLYKFKVTANTGDVYMYKFHFTVSSSTYAATTTNYGLYAYTDSGYSSADTVFSTNGLLNESYYVNGIGANSGTGGLRQPNGH